MHIEIPDNFLRVTPEKFTEVADQVFYIRGRYTNATEYRFRSSRLKRVTGDTFGYEDTKGQYYLRQDILEEVNAGAWDTTDI